MLRFLAACQVVPAAARRSQADTAKVLEGKIAAGGKLNVVLGEKGPAERGVNLR